MNSKDLQTKTNYFFSNHNLCREALTHPSYANEHAGSIPSVSYERLEFLGDSILNTIITITLYEQYPDLAEGKLTQIRSQIVNGETLASIAHELGIGEILIMGKGEEATGGRTRPSNLAAGLEALIGAVFLDSSFGITKDFILGLFKNSLSEVSPTNVSYDPKSYLQEYLQSKGNDAPKYELLDVIGPEHQQYFRVQVTYNNKIMGSGTGKTRREAEKSAAQQALNTLRLKH